MKHPLAALALVFCSGIGIADLARPGFVLVYSLAAVFLMLSFLLAKNRLCFGLCFLSAVLFSGAACLRNIYVIPEYHLGHYRYLKSKVDYVLKGFVDSEPARKAERTTFIFSVKELQSEGSNRKCLGKVLVQARMRANLEYGDSLILQGRMYRPFGFGGSRSRSYRRYLDDQDIRFILSVRSEACVVRLGRNDGARLRRIALCSKQKIESVIFRNSSDLTAGILDAMVLGSKDHIPPFIYHAMVKSGTVHILVVSGFNVGLVAGVIILLLRLARVPRKARFFSAVILIIFYCLITGASTPVVRATVMAVIFMSAYFLKRDPDIYNSLSVAAIGILAFNPRQLFDLGFQLSFVSVFSIVWLYPRLRALTRLGELNARFIRWPLEGFLVSFSAWLGTMGLIAYNFRFFSPVTALANIFVVPLASLITLCGFSLVITSFIHPGAAHLSSLTAETVIAAMLRVNLLLLNLPGAYFYFPA
jgi:competence protein ComEC